MPASLVLELLSRISTGVVEKYKYDGESVDPERGPAEMPRRGYLIERKSGQNAEVKERSMLRFQLLKSAENEAD